MLVKLPQQSVCFSMQVELTYPEVLQFSLGLEVHHGNTKMDYMEQERKRGITIRAATIAFNWEDHQINLIDTPGHVDFTAEVERSLRVCDGAVALFDAMQGVETQSETVWMQANKFKIPRIAFINKLDRQGASVHLTVESVKRRLKVEPLLINIPGKEDSQLKSLIDLPSMTNIEYKDELGKMVSFETIDENHQYYQRAMQYRNQLIEQLANYDDHLADLYLSEQPIDQDLIEKVLQKAIWSQKCVGLLCGSALKNKGVQPLMDAIIKYLPSPHGLVIQGRDKVTNTVLTRHSNKKEKLCALAFKVVNDKEKGLVTFFRVYSGVLKNKQKIVNSNTGQTERIMSLFRMRADEAQLINDIGVGDIGAITGCKDIRSGDTIIDENDKEYIVLEGVKMPPAVFFCSIEAEQSRDSQELEKILYNLSREDPSIVIIKLICQSVKNDEETGQLLVSGLGELHLEILRDRIELEYGIKSELGPMRVAYRESCGKLMEGEIELEKQIGGQNLYAKIKIQIETTLDEIDIQELQKKKFEQLDFTKSHSDSSFSLDQMRTEESQGQSESSLSSNQILFDFEDLTPVSERIKLDGDEYEAKGKQRRDKDIMSAASANYEIYRSLDSLPLESRASMKTALEDVLMSGPLLGYPLVNMKVRILDGRWSNIRSKNPVIFQMAAGQLLKQLIDQSSPVLLEPFMNVEITVPDHCIGEIMSDTTGKKGGNILGIRNVEAKFFDQEDTGSSRVDDKRKCVNALIPLSEMVGYTTYLRSLTKGEGQFVMTFSHYERTNGGKQAEMFSDKIE